MIYELHLLLAQTVHPVLSLLAEERHSLVIDHNWEIFSQILLCFILINLFDRFHEAALRSRKSKLRGVVNVHR